MKTNIKHSLQTFVCLIFVASILSWLANIFGFGSSNDKRGNQSSITHHVYSDVSEDEMNRVLGQQKPQRILVLQGDKHPEWGTLQLTRRVTN